MSYFDVRPPEFKSKGIIHESTFGTKYSWWFSIKVASCCGVREISFPCKDRVWFSGWHQQLFFLHAWVTWPVAVFYFVAREKQKCIESHIDMLLMMHEVKVVRRDKVRPTSSLWYWAYNDISLWQCKFIASPVYALKLKKMALLQTLKFFLDTTDDISSWLLILSKTDFCFLKY